jgi:hypothetical protein
MNVVYMISMWLSTAPFVSRMYVSELFIDHFGVLHYSDKRGASQAFNRFTHNFLFRHTVVIVLAIIVLGFVEDKMVRENPVVDFFDVIFEVISGYGNVGLSMGFPGSMASLCGNMSTVGKLVLIFVMMLGKLRGLPTHSDSVSDFSFKEMKFWVRKAKKEKKQAEGADVSSRIPEREESFEEFQKQRLHDGQLEKALKTLRTRNVDERLNKIQSFVRVHISISFSQSSAFVISVPC